MQKLLKDLVGFVFRLLAFGGSGGVA